MGPENLILIALKFNSVYFADKFFNFFGFIPIRDWKTLAVCVVVNLGLFAVSESIRRMFGLSGLFNKKFIHTAVALWGVSVFFIFQTKEAAIILPVLFILSNTGFMREFIFKLAHIEGSNHHGTIYYPVAMVMLIWFCWEQNERWAGIVGMLNLGLGDSFAGIIGFHYGKIKYKIGECSKTYLGSIIMFSISFAASLIVIFIKNNGLGWYDIGASAAIAFGAAVFEGLCANGLDNLSVPLGSACIYSLFYL